MSDQHYYLQQGDGQTESGQAYPLDSLPCVIGRSSECGLQLDFDRISRKHASFESSSNGLLLTDLDSTNGTFVNHERISSPTLVRPGDSVHFANHAFSLQYRQPSGSTLHFSPPEQRQRASDTVIGFTAAPTGFPVQAPEFFELLNDEQITGTCQPIKSAGGTLYGYSLRGRGNHPKLSANSATLFRLAEDLGEELRLAELVRKKCLELADQAALQSNLFIEVHPVECEEIEVLIEELAELCSQFRHLALVIEVPLGNPDDAAILNALRKKLGAYDVELCGRAVDPATLLTLEPLADSLDYLRLPAGLGAEGIADARRALKGRARILIDGIDQVDLVAAFSEAGASLFQGEAVGSAVPIAEVA